DDLSPQGLDLVGLRSVGPGHGGDLFLLAADKLAVPAAGLFHGVELGLDGLAVDVVHHLAQLLEAGEAEVDGSLELDVHAEVDDGFLAARLAVHRSTASSAPGAAGEPARSWVLGVPQDEHLHAFLLDLLLEPAGRRAEEDARRPERIRDLQPQ